MTGLDNLVDFGSDKLPQCQNDNQKFADKLKFTFQKTVPKDNETDKRFLILYRKKTGRNLHEFEILASISTQLF